MPAASRQEGLPGDGPRAWPNGPGRAGPARRGGDTFLLNSPRSPDGGGGGPNTKPGAQRPTACSCEAASPPGDHWGAERPSWRAGRPPTRPGRPGPSTADLAAGMTTAQPAAGWLLERAGTGMDGRGDPREPSHHQPMKSVRVSGSCPRRNDDVRRSPASCRLDSFKGARPRPEEVGKRSALRRAWHRKECPRRRGPGGDRRQAARRRRRPRPRARGPRNGGTTPRPPGGRSGGRWRAGSDPIGRGGRDGRGSPRAGASPAGAVRPRQRLPRAGGPQDWPGMA